MFEEFRDKMNYPLIKIPVSCESKDSGGARVDLLESAFDSLPPCSLIVGIADSVQSEPNLLIGIHAPNAAISNRNLPQTSGNHFPSVAQSESISRSFAIPNPFLINKKESSSSS